MLNRDQILALVGDFTWLWGQEFFVETSVGNFIWNDPDYGGDNTFTAFSGSYTDYLKKAGIDFGRDKGRHVISDYCGDQIVLVV